MNGNNTIFDIYNETGLPINLIIINILRIIISSFGVLFNASLRYKTLKSSCHLLIAFDCFVSSFYQINSLLTITVLFNIGYQFLPIRLCCIEILPPFLIGFTASFISTYFISFDRLIKKLKNKYLIFILICICIFHSFIAYGGFQIVFTVPETNQIICAPHECVWGWASDLIYFIFSFFYILTLINYIIIWIMLKWTTKKNQKQSSSFAWAYRILKTLSILVLLNLIGFSMNCIVRLSVPRFDLNVTQRTLIIHSLSCLTNLVMTLNAPILFIFNQDYKKHF
ncbi:hypothetical protein Mgra_00004255 [Meloidogyne graminicola]|uniref:G_PROTEIN_RECEP_F1_2 domain-containing protein n=1 Tax=Meloidogyne graminicola TaxID=189291 RepID=A0A8S9ZST6_9BILA|nr:hypothetical protein Mgra_00004255 [Meloidogyne graminicola]